jgi:propionyl-CoA carboxylase alpha chain
MIRKILIANRGVIALRIVRACRRLGIRSVAVYSDADKQSPHVHLADEAVSLGPSDGQHVYMNQMGMIEAARRTEADTVHPGSGFLAGDADFATACETRGLTFIGPSADILRANATAHELVLKRGIPIAPYRREAALRQIEFQIFGDHDGNVIHLLDRDCSIQKDGNKYLFESPAPSLGDDLRARMAETAVSLAREIGYYNAATVQFLLMPSGQFYWLGVEPFLSAEHTVTEAATGLDLIELQMSVAEGRRLQSEVPRARGHAIGAGLYSASAPGTLRVWNPPPGSGDLRIEGGVEEGMQIPTFDPLAQLVCTDTVRDGAIRKLSQALSALWVGGIENNQELLLQVLESTDFQGGKVGVGFLENYALKSRASSTRDIAFAAAMVLYFENTRHAQRTVLSTVPPNYRNNPYRDPSMTLRMGPTDVAMSWRRLGQNRYVMYSGATEVAAEVLALGPGTMSLALDGVLREFRFREVANEVFVHSPLGSQVIKQLTRYSNTETSAIARPPTIPDQSKSVTHPPSKPGKARRGSPDHAGGLTEG